MTLIPRRYTEFPAYLIRTYRSEEERQHGSASGASYSILPTSVNTRAGLLFDLTRVWMTLNDGHFLVWDGHNEAITPVGQVPTLDFAVEHGIAVVRDAPIEVRPFYGRNSARSGAVECFQTKDEAMSRARRLIAVGDLGGEGAATRVRVVDTGPQPEKTVARLPVPTRRR